MNPNDAANLNILPPPPSAVIITDLRPVDEGIDTLALDRDSYRLAGGRDGLALLTADDFIGAPIDPNDSDTVRTLEFRGLETLGPIEEISILAIPDIHIHPVPRTRNSAARPLCAGSVPRSAAASTARS